MLKITKAGEPDFLKKYKKKYRPGNWAGYDRENIRERLKAFIFECEQKYAEVSCCVYCEKAVGQDDSHIEHIRPKSVFKKYEQDYSNLSVSCGKDGGSDRTCGHYKANSYADDFIHPAEDDPASFMTYEIMTGKIVPLSDDGKRAEYTINLLNLNHNKLVRFRKTLFVWLKNSVTDEEELSYYYKYGFPVLLEYYKKECHG